MAGRVKVLLQAAAVTVVALLLALLGWQVAAEGKVRSLADRLEAGDSPEAPGFEVERLDQNGSVSLESLRGKAVVLNFWASWCEPCKEEAPRLEAAWRRYRDDGLVVLGIDAQDFRKDARGFVERYGLTYPIVHDGPGATIGRYGVTGFPETWFVGRNGRLVGERIQGPVSEEQLERGIQRALGAAS
jgi:cytochrome c biogenesis protein CcmG, thiol:disulfide interchange protein DsbE